MDGGGDPWSWYMEIPPVSRAYLTGAILLTGLCALDIVSPYSFYFNPHLIYEQGQLWRLVTNFLFFGSLSIDFLFHMYFLVRYSRLLEEGEFRGRTADFVLMLLFGAFLMTLMAPFLAVNFMSSSLTFMMVYVWGRRNEHVRMSLLGLLPFTAPYLPWVLLAFSLVLQNPLTMDLVGIAVGHIYYFLEFVYPEVANIRGWRLKKVMVTPAFLRALCGQHEGLENFPGVVDAFDWNNPPPEGNGNVWGAAGAGAAAAAGVDGQPAAAAAAGGGGGGGDDNELRRRRLGNVGDDGVPVVAVAAGGAAAAGGAGVVGDHAHEE